MPPEAVAPAAVTTRVLPRLVRSRIGAVAVLAGVVLASAACGYFEPPPVVDSVSIEPVVLDSTSRATARVVAHDPRGAELTYVYQWTRNGKDIPGASDPTLELRQVGRGDRGDAIAVRVTAVAAERTSRAAVSSEIRVGPSVVIDMPESRDSYPLEGADSRALFASICRNGLTDGETTTPVSGLTVFGAQKQDVRTVQLDGACALDVMSFENNIVVTLPKLAPAARSADLDAKVTRFTEAVRIHEERHVQIRRQHLGDLARTLKTLPPEPSCETLKRSISRAVQSMIDTERRAQDRFHEEDAARIKTACATLDQQVSSLASTLASLRSSQPAGYNALVPTHNALVDDRNWCLQT